MIKYTPTQDWLHIQAGLMDDVFVSGDPSFSKKLGITQHCIASLRFAANRREIFGYFLTLQANIDFWEILESEIMRSSAIKNNFLRFERLLSKTIPIILYDNAHPDCFAISIDKNRFDRVNSDELEVFFSNYSRKITQNPGTFKDINKSINDSFQKWTRFHLSKYLVINDFDMIIPSKSLIIELKRVVERIEDWRPYLDDKGNYLALSKICSTNHLRMHTIAYNYDREIIAIHDLITINDHIIVGEFCICQISDIIHPNPDDVDVKHCYKSSRRRR